jgi:ubiquinone/menaquinone biosynthesis C-methylase UbiE
MSNEKFDKKAKDWDKSQRRIEMNIAFKSKIEEKYKFNEEDIVIDYGAGTGNLGLNFASKVKKIYFIDPSKGMLEQLSEKASKFRIENIELLQNDHINEFQIKEKIDLIFSAMALHHVKNLEKLVMEISKVLSDKGQIFLFDLDEEDGSFHDGDFDGHYGIPREKLEKILIEKGFSEIVFEDVYLVKKKRNEEEKQYNVFMCWARYK